jgi:hypothetical protein
MFRFLAIKEMQIKTSLRFHLTPARRAIIKKINPNAGDNMGERGSYTLLVRR